MEILCNTKYSLGQEIVRFIESFQNQYRNIEESARMLPQPLESSRDLINETVSNIYQHYNFGNGQTSLKHCRMTVESHILTSIYNSIIRMYSHSVLELKNKLNELRQDWKTKSQEQVAEEFDVIIAQDRYNNDIKLINGVQKGFSPSTKLEAITKVVRIHKANR